MSSTSTSTPIQTQNQKRILIKDVIFDTSKPIRIRLNKNSLSSTRTKEHKVMPEIIDIKPFYTLIENDGTETNYSTLIDIAHDKHTSISNIYHLIEQKRVKGLNFKVIKEEHPYVFNFNGEEFTGKTIKEIAGKCSLSISTIHHLIIDFLQKK